MESFFESYGPEFGMSLVAMLAIGMLYLFVRSLFWAYGDAVARGKSGWVVVLLITIFKWPVSLLLWIVFRPPLKEQAAGPARFDAPAKC